LDLPNFGFALFFYLIEHFPTFSNFFPSFNEDHPRFPHIPQLTLPSRFFIFLFLLVFPRFPRLPLFFFFACCWGCCCCWSISRGLTEGAAPKEASAECCCWRADARPGVSPPPPPLSLIVGGLYK
jgi:hypothetical protein